MIKDQEKKIKEAIKGVKEGKFTTIRKAAILFELAESTLRSRYEEKGKTRVDGYEG